MDTREIIHNLTEPEGLPVAALNAAGERREELVPLFIEELEDLILHPEHEDEEGWRLFFIFHLMAQWREQRAYMSKGRRSLLFDLWPRYAARRPWRVLLGALIAVVVFGRPT